MLHPATTTRDPRVLFFARTAFITLTLLAWTLIAPGVATAQSDREHWGVDFSYTPAWETAPAIRNLLEEEEGDEVNFKGSDLTIGFVHGRPHGGDWGVSFTYKKFKDEVAVKSVSQNCFPGLNQQQICYTETETNTPQDAFIAGAEVHWFIPFVRIKERTQIGINVAGGIGVSKGNLVKVTDTSESKFVQGPTPGSGSIVLTPVHEEEVLKFADELFPIFPMAKAEAVASFLAGTSFKIKAAYGINFPSYSFRLIGTYLFGD